MQNSLKKKKGMSTEKLEKREIEKSMFKVRNRVRAADLEITKSKGDTTN